MEQIRTLLTTWKDNYFDAYFIICEQYLKQAELPAKVICESLQFEGKSDNRDVDFKNITKEEFGSIARTYASLINDLIVLWESKNPTEEQFYDKIYNTIFNSDLFPSDSKSQAVFLVLLTETYPAIPYYRAEEVLIMPEDEYKTAVKRLEPWLTRTLHMYFRPFPSKTERVSQLYRIASEIESKEDQIVYWSVVLNLKKELKSDTSGE